MANWHRLRDTAGVLMLLDVATELGLSKQDCLVSTRIDIDQLDAPLASISVWQELTLIRNIQKIRCTDEQLGLLVSKRCTADTMGMFGQALATSETLSQAWELMERYQMLGLAFSRFEFSSDRHNLRMTLHDAEMPMDCQRFCEERGLGGCLTLFSDLLGHPIKPQTVKMRLPAPATPDIYHDFFGVSVKFGCQRTEILFDRKIESLLLPKANRKLHLASLRHCDEVIESHTEATSYADRIRALLEQRGINTSLEQTAEHFGITSRQLRRHLGEETTSFRALQLSLKLDQADALLRSGLSVNQVALELGYASQASFSRAFKKHKGINPSELCR